MLHDLIVVGTGPVGATLALCLVDGELDVVALDARAPGTLGRGDRSLALSHGARLILERIGVWCAAAAGATRDGVEMEVAARLVALADGSGDIAAGIARRRHDYGQVALVAKVWS